MTELDKKIKQLSWRMRLVRMVYATSRALFYAVCAAAVLVLTERLLYVSFDIWTATALLAAVTIPIGIFYAFLLRKAHYKAAVGADENVGLEARLSSALLLKDQKQDPLVGLLIADATSTAKKIKASQAFPLQFSRETRFVFVPILALIGFSFIPELDLLGKKAEIQAVQAEQQEVKKTAERLAPAVKKLQEQAEKNKLEETQDLAQKMEELKLRLERGKIDRKEGLAKLSTLQDQVEQMKKRYEAETKGQRGIRQTSEMKFAKKLADSLRKGDFKQAAEEMKDLQDKVRNGELSERDMEALKRELEQISRDTSSQNSKLSKAFAEASKSMEKKSGQENQQQEQGDGQNQNDGGQQQQSQSNSNNQQQNQGDGMESAQKQIEQMSRMAEDAKALEQASEACKQCKNGLSNNSSSKTGSLGKSGTGMQSDQGKSMASKEGTEGKAGKEGESQTQNSGSGQCESCGSSECKGNCQGSGQGTKASTGKWTAGATEGKKGAGMGGPGQGRGGRPEDGGDVDVDFEEFRPPGQFDPRAELDATWEVEGDPLESQSNMALVPSMKTHDDQASDDALTKEEVPIGYEDLVRDYFGDLDNAASN